VPDGSITGTKLAPGGITSVSLSNNIALGNSNSISGRLDVYRTLVGTPAVSIIGSSSQISTYGSDGREQIRLYGTSWGELWLNNNLSNNATAVLLTAQGSSGGKLELRNTNGSNRAVLEGENLAARSPSIKPMDSSVFLSMAIAAGRIGFGAGHQRQHACQHGRQRQWRRFGAPV